MATAFKADHDRFSTPAAEVPLLRLIQRPLPSLDDLPEVATNWDAPSDIDNFLELGLETEIEASLAHYEDDHFEHLDTAVFTRRSTFAMTIQSGLRRGETLTLLVQHVDPLSYLAIMEALATGRLITIQIAIVRAATSALIFATNAELRDAS